MFTRGEKFVAVGHEVRPGHVDSGGGSRRRGMRASMAKRQTRPFGAPEFTPRQKRALAFTYATVLMMLLYFGTIGVALVGRDFTIWDRLGSLLLLFGLGFIFLHGFGYANSMIKASWTYREFRAHLFAPTTVPRVVCIVACYNEPPDVLDETIGSVVAMEYPNKEIVILDDSTKDEAKQAARDIAAKYGVKCVQRTTRRGYKAGAINDFLPMTDAPYLAIFDADALPATNFLREVMPIIDENPRLAFLQTPQFYANTEVSNVAMASARQQDVFYEYICEGKSYSRAAFCCGTNVVFRRNALMDVGGFNEVTVTEDFATSFDMHLKGWDTLYYNRVYVYSLAPENLAAYFMQQSRWSFGSLGTGRAVVGSFFKNPFKLRMGQWFEYFLSVTYYWVGWANFFFMLLPMLYIFFGIRPMRQDVWTYMAVFVPYFVFSLNMFYSGMEARGLKIGEMVLGQQIGFISFPIHMTSAVSAMLGRKRPFGVTPKGVGGRLPWKVLWPQITMMVLSGIAFAVGAFKYAAGYDRNTTAAVINSLWALYHVWMLSSIFVLNQPVREGVKGFFENPEQEREPYLYPQAEKPSLSATRVLTRIATGAGLIALATILWAGFCVQNWAWAPEYPVNVAIVDRTVGLEGQEHRALTWTLNYLKVRKQSNFLGTPGRDYNWRTDYYGFIPGLKPRPRTENGESVVYASNRPLPPRLNTPGLIYLADTFGEFAQTDPGGKKTVRYRSTPRGLTPPEIDSLVLFGRRGGLLVSEWNVLGYPTNPGQYNSPTAVERQLRQLHALQRAAEVRLPSLKAQQRTTTWDNPALSTQLGKAYDKLKQQIEAMKATQKELRFELAYDSVSAEQAAAAKKLELALHVDYLGWYGRYVDDFARERKYDPKLYQSVRASLSKRAGKPVMPSGAGFVFYSTKRRPGKDQEPEPIVVLGNPAGTTATNGIAVITRSTDPGSSSDPLLKGVAAQVPGRSWFGVVRPGRGSRVLAYYKLQINPESAAVLRAAKFPAPYISPDGKALSLPAMVASRDIDGALESLYFAGDAAESPAIPPLLERFPALAGVSTPFTGAVGAFPSQYYWGFYQPVMRNLFEEVKRIRYN